jgi:signal transduction histidine kinase
MTAEITNLIQQCAWAPSKFLIISANVYSPLLYYSYIGSVVPALIIALTIFLKDRKALASRLLLATVGALSLWIFGALVVWATEIPKYTMFFWGTLTIFEPLIYFFAFYFAYVFIYKKDFSIKQKMFFLLPILPTIFLASTHYMLLGYDLSNCDRNTYEGFMTSYGYIIEILYVVCIWVSLFLSRKKFMLPDERKKNLLLAVGVSAFLLSFSIGNIVEVFTQNWYVGQYGLFGAPVFVGFLAYLIVKYKAFNIRLVAAQIFIVSLFVVTGSMLFINSLKDLHTIIAITLVLLFVVGYFLIRSVKKEIEQKEKLEQLRLKLEESNLDLANANEKLKSLDKLKSEFLSLAAHQLRSPLTAIKGYSSMLDEGFYGKLTDPQDEAIRRVYASAQGLVNIVEDLLNISKIEQGGMKYSFSPVELGNIVHMVCNEMEIPAKNKHLDFRVLISKTDKYMVVADATKIRQVVLNLIDNSIKYTPAGFVEVSLKKDADKIIFAVRDSGVGVSPETKDKLFQKFSRGEGGKLNTGGSGLGLYLAKEISKAHKGDVIIDSEGLGHGSTFSLVLPIAGSQTKDFNVAT